MTECSKDHNISGLFLPEFAPLFITGSRSETNEVLPLRWDFYRVPYRTVLYSNNYIPLMKYMWLWWIYVGIVSYIWGYNHICIHPITNIFRVYGKDLRPISFTFIEGIAKLCMGHCLQIYIVILPAIKLDQQWYLTALQKYIRLFHLLSICLAVILIIFATFDPFALSSRLLKPSPVILFHFTSKLH